MFCSEVKLVLHHIAGALTDADSIDVIGIILILLTAYCSA